MELLRALPNLDSKKLPPLLDRDLAISTGLLLSDVPFGLFSCFSSLKTINCFPKANSLPSELPHNSMVGSEVDSEVTLKDESIDTER